MSSAARGHFADRTVEIPPEKIEEIKACIHSKSGIVQNLPGIGIGITLSSLPFVFAKHKVAKSKAVPLILMGAVYGYFVSSYIRAKDCAAKFFNDSEAVIINPNLTYVGREPLVVNMYENRKVRPEDQEQAKAEISSKESIFDSESQLSMNYLDDVPVINESADVQNKEPERTLTYKELRERNRGSQKPRNVYEPPMWNRGRNREQQSKAQVSEFETESKESNFFSDPSTGNHKTKYGDVWD